MKYIVHYVSKVDTIEGQTVYFSLKTALFWVYYWFYDHRIDSCVIYRIDDVYTSIEIAEIYNTGGESK